MPSLFDLLYREYCRARLAEMRKHLLISPERHEVPEAICDAKDAVGAVPTSHVSGGEVAPSAPVLDIPGGNGSSAWATAVMDELRFAGARSEDGRLMNVRATRTASRNERLWNRPLLAQTVT